MGLNNLTQLVATRDYKSKNTGASYRNMPLATYYPDNGPLAWDKYLNTHIPVIQATKDWYNIYIIGGNGIGKTMMMCWLATTVARGEYPHWYDGIKFQPGVRQANGKIYNRIQILIMSQEISTIKGAIFKYFLGEKFVDQKSEDLDMAGTGMINKEWLARDDKGEIMAKYDKYHHGLESLFITHKPTGTNSRIDFKAYSQGANSIRSAEYNLALNDEKNTEHLRTEVAARTHTRYTDSRYMMFNTLDTQNNEVDDDLSHRLLEQKIVAEIDIEGTREVTKIVNGKAQQVIEEYVEQKEVKQSRTFTISQYDLPHFTREQISALDGAMTSQDLSDARIHGYPSMDDRRVITPRPEKIYLKDDDGMDIDFTDDDKRADYIEELKRKGWFRIFSIDVGSRSFGCLGGWAWLEDESDLQLLRSLKVVITEGYNYHTEKKSDKGTDFHLNHIIQLLAIRGKMIHSGLVDGTALWNLSEPTQGNFRDLIAKRMYNDVDINQQKLRNTNKQRTLQKRADWVNELFNRDAIKIMHYEKDGRSLKWLRDEPYISVGLLELERQMLNWKYRKDPETKFMDIRKQDGKNYHLVKDCLTTMLWCNDLRYMYRANKGVDVYDRSRSGMSQTYKALEAVQQERDFISAY